MEMNSSNWKEMFLILSLTNDTKIYDKLKEHIPKTIYKYVSLSNVKNDELDKQKINTFKEDKIYLATPEKFNDPYDCQLNMDVSDELRKAVNLFCESEINKSVENREDRRKAKKVKKSFYKEVDVSKKIERLIKELDNDWKKFKREISASCLSEQNDSILMWAHYTNAYNGFCIEYRLDEIIDTLRKQRCNILPVKYSDELQSLSKYITKYKENEIVLAGIQATISKAKVWEYEREWRILGMLDENNEEGMCINMPKPTKLYLGPKLLENNKIHLLNLAIEKGISTVDVRINPKKYQLIEITLNAMQEKKQR